MVRPDNSRSLGVARRLGLRPIRDDVLNGVPVIVHAVDRERWGVGGLADELDAFLAHVAEWAQAQADLVAVALVGSRTCQTSGPESDADLVFLSRDPGRYVRREDWAQELGACAVQATAHRGALIEQRLRMASGLQLDVAIGGAMWASSDPLDPGTARVVREGCRIVHDPEGILARLQAAVA
jgi:hypothetical protein